MLDTFEVILGSRSPGVGTIVSGFMKHMDSTGTDIFGNQDSPIQILMKRSMGMGSIGSGDEAE